MLYFTTDELNTLKALRTQPSHQAIWNNIKSWADGRIGDSLPSQSESYKVATQIRNYLETMGFMFAMTEDPAYADAAKDCMLSVSSWSSWGNYHFTCIVARGLAFSYDVLYNYLAPSERETIRNAMVTYVGAVYSQYNHPDFAPDYACTIAALANSIGLSGLALEGDYTGASDWIDFGVTHAERALTYGGIDGGWYEGELYGSLATLFLTSFLDALKRVKGVDLFDNEFLRQTPYYYIYCNYNGKPLQFEDANWREGYLTDEKCQLSFLYKLASEYNNGYAQWFAEAYADQSVMQTFIWKDPVLVPIPPTDLPLTKHFRDLGYVIFRNGWGANDLLFAFKSGASRGHAHPSQNEFGIYYQGKPITCGPGYVCMTDLDTTWPHNCILVNGLGQCQEPGDYSCAPLGTRGKILALEEKAGNYVYTLGDASAVYTGWKGTSDGRTYEVGKLDKWLRHVVFVKSPNYFVIFDELVASEAKRFNWVLNSSGVTSTGGKTSRPTISVAGDLITLTQNGTALKVIVVEPEGFNHEFVSYDIWVLFNQIRVSTPAPLLTAHFLTALFPNSVFPIEEVKVGNCLGVIVSYNNRKDLIVFSSDGNPVDQYVELNGHYKAADGGSYEFDGTRVRTRFTTYLVMRLQQAPPAEQTVELAPGESKVVSFEAVPHEPGTYLVTVDGLQGSFRAV